MDKDLMKENQRLVEKYISLAEVCERQMKEIPELREERDEAMQFVLAKNGELAALLAQIAVMREALTKINAIRNSIIGLQTMNWSEHIYPLVAALNEAGFKGMDYPAAREYFGTMLERTNATELDKKRLDCLDKYQTGNTGERYWKVYGEGTLREAIDGQIAIEENDKHV